MRAIAVVSATLPMLLPIVRLLYHHRGAVAGTMMMPPLPPLLFNSVPDIIATLLLSTMTPQTVSRVAMSAATPSLKRTAAPPAPFADAPSTQQ